MPLTTGSRNSEIVYKKQKWIAFFRNKTHNHPLLFFGKKFEGKLVDVNPEKIEHLSKVSSATKVAEDLKAIEFEITRVNLLF